jgi:hypothetical protein
VGGEVRQVVGSSQLGFEARGSLRAGVQCLERLAVYRIRSTYSALRLGFDFGVVAMC